MHLLIVEDNADLARLVTALLCDHEIQVVTDPALVTAEVIGEAEAALVDYMMPGEDGCAVLARIALVNPACRRVLWTAAPPLVPCPHAHRMLIKPNGIDEITEALNGR